MVPRKFSRKTGNLEAVIRLWPLPLWANRMCSSICLFVAKPWPWSPLYSAAELWFFQDSVAPCHSHTNTDSLAAIATTFHSLKHSGPVPLRLCIYWVLLCNWGGGSPCRRKLNRRWGKEHNLSELASSPTLAPYKLGYGLKFWWTSKQLLNGCSFMPLKLVYECRYWSVAMCRKFAEHK